MGRLFYIVMSGDKPDLSLYEIKCFVEGIFGDRCFVEYFNGGLFIYNCNVSYMDLEAISRLRLSYIKEFGEVLCYRYIDGEVDVGSLYSFLEYSFRELGGFRIGRIIVEGVDLSIDWVLLKKRYSDYSSDRLVTLIVASGMIAIGRYIASRDKEQFDKSSRISVDFRSPGSMNMVDQNFMVNVLYLKSRFSPGNIYDPFMGTGKLLLRPCLDSYRVVGSDISVEKSYSSYARLRRYGCVDMDLVISDSTIMPFRDGIIDLIMTDLPYGRQSSIRYIDKKTFIARVLDEFSRVLRLGGLALIAFSHDQLNDVIDYIDRLSNLRVVDIVSEYVHSSLIRIYMMIEKR